MNWSDEGQIFDDHEPAAQSEGESPFRVRFPVIDVGGVGRHNQDRDPSVELMAQDELGVDLD